MPNGIGSFDAGNVNEVEISIDVAVLADALLADQRFINAVAKAVTVAMTKDARLMGNLFGTWAQKPAPVQPTRQRTR